MGVARILVSTELLREALHLPVTTEIRLARTDRYGEIELTVADPGIDETVVAAGEMAPLVNPTFRKQEPVVFVGWK